MISQKVHASRVSCNEDRGSDNLGTLTGWYYEVLARGIEHQIDRVFSFGDGRVLLNSSRR